LVRSSHICHRTSSSKVGKDDFLFLTCQDICAFGHEMDAAENDEFGIWVISCSLRQLE
jgi:hypothetical protein